MQKNLNAKPQMVAFASTFLGLFIRNLEMNGWKLDSFGNKDTAERMTNSLQDAFAVIAKKMNVAQPKLLFLLNSFFYKSAIAIARWMMPFDLETYLEFHFTKVGPQMRMGLENIKKDARVLGVDTPFLDLLTEF